MFSIIDLETELIKNVDFDTLYNLRYTCKFYYNYIDKKKLILLNDIEISAKNKNIYHRYKHYQIKKLLFACETNNFISVICTWKLINDEYTCMPNRNKYRVMDTVGACLIKSIELDNLNIFVFIYNIFNNQMTNRCSCGRFLSSIYKYYLKTLEGVSINTEHIILKYIVYNKSISIFNHIFKNHPYLCEYLDKSFDDIIHTNADKLNIRFLDNILKFANMVNKKLDTDKLIHMINLLNNELKYNKFKRYVKKYMPRYKDK